MTYFIMELVDLHGRFPQIDQFFDYLSCRNGS
jgi:hypothetical protein